MSRTGVVAAELGEALRNLLPGISSRSIEALIRAAGTGSFRRRDRILTEEAEPRFALILDGYAATWRTDPDGRTTLVAVSGPGEFAALRALSPSRAPIELVALTNGRAATWDPDTVLAVARADAGLAVELLELSLLAADALLARHDHLSLGSATERIVGVLWTWRELVFDAGRPILTRQQLAELAGASRDMTDRVIRELEEESILERVGRSGLVLHDPVSLRAMAEEAGEP